jgi:hypothetical protein
LTERYSESESGFESSDEEDEEIDEERAVEDDDEDKKEMHNPYIQDDEEGKGIDAIDVRLALLTHTSRALSLDSLTSTTS